jgi:hypothetical protein
MGESPGSDHPDAAASRRKFGRLAIEVASLGTAHFRDLETLPDQTFPKRVRC